jgi:hypothetical protein
MSETSTVEGRDSKSGRFLSGCKPGPGRAKGSRNRLASDFLAAFADDFEKHGAAVIAKVRDEKPDVYLRVAADLLPRDLNVNLDVAVDVANFAERFRAAYELLGNPEPPRPRRPLKVINGR